MFRKDTLKHIYTFNHVFYIFRKKKVVGSSQQTNIFRHCICTFSQTHTIWELNVWFIKNNKPGKGLQNPGSWDCRCRVRVLSHRRVSLGSPCGSCAETEKKKWGGRVRHTYRLGREIAQGDKVWSLFNRLMYVVIINRFYWQYVQSDKWHQRRLLIIL